jgi:hypothetical protein
MKKKILILQLKKSNKNIIIKFILQKMSFNLIYIFMKMRKKVG